MPRGTLLTDHDKGQIDALLAEKLSQRAIAKKIGRSPKAIRNCIKATSATQAQPPPVHPAPRKTRLQLRSIRQFFLARHHEESKLS
jgi:IS30 family transposase